MFVRLRFRPGRGWIVRLDLSAGATRFTRLVHYDIMHALVRHDSRCIPEGFDCIKGSIDRSHQLISLYKAKPRFEMNTTRTREHRYLLVSTHI